MRAQAPPRVVVDSREPSANDGVQGPTDVHAAGRMMAALARSWPAPSADPVPVPEHPSEEARRAELQREVEFHESQVTRMRSEPRLASFAEPMEQRIEQLFRSPVQGYGVRYESAECRSHSCIATLSWASREQAQAELESAMARAISLPCARELVLPPAGSGAQRYEATIFLDCQAVRGEGRTAGR